MKDMENLNRKIKVIIERQSFGRLVSCHSVDSTGMCAAAHALLKALKEYPRDIEFFGVEVFDAQADKCIYIFDDQDITRLMTKCTDLASHTRALRSISGAIKDAYSPK